MTAAGERCPLTGIRVIDLATERAELCGRVPPTSAPR
jgi:hypothetical protein